MKCYIGRHKNIKSWWGIRMASGIQPRKTALSVAVTAVAWIDRKIPYFEVLNDEAIEVIEDNAETVLQEIGIEFRDFPRALKLFADAGADVDGERVRFPRGCVVQLLRRARRRNTCSTQETRNAVS